MNPTICLSSAKLKKAKTHAHNISFVDSMILSTKEML